MQPYSLRLNLGSDGYESFYFPVDVTTKRPSHNVESAPQQYTTISSRPPPNRFSISTSRAHSAATRTHSTPNRKFQANHQASIRKLERTEGKKFLSLTTTKPIERQLTEFRRIQQGFFRRRTRRINPWIAAGHISKETPNDRRRRCRHHHQIRGKPCTTLLIGKHSN